MKLWGDVYLTALVLGPLSPTLALVIGLSVLPAMMLQSSIARHGHPDKSDPTLSRGAAKCRRRLCIKLTDLGTGAAFASISNDAGRYDFPTVPPGKYDITFTKEGFSTYDIKSQNVEVGTVLTLNASLKVGSTSTTVEVSATVGADLQTINATVGSTLSNTSLMVLPNLGRDATSMAVLQPGTTLGGNAAGSPADLNTYQLDGANITDDMSGNVTSYQTNMNGLGGTQNSQSPSGVIPTPIESIEEFTGLRLAIDDFGFQ